MHAQTPAERLRLRQRMVHYLFYALGGTPRACPIALVPRLLRFLCRWFIFAGVLTLVPSSVEDHYYSYGSRYRSLRGFRAYRFTTCVCRAHFFLCRILRPRVRRLHSPYRTAGAASYLPRCTRCAIVWTYAHGLPLLHLLRWFPLLLVCLVRRVRRMPCIAMGRDGRFYTTLSLFSILFFTTRPRLTPPYHRT